MSTTSREGIRQACLSQILKSVGQAEVADFPFPHFFARNLFPWDLYARLQECLPDTAHYKLLDKYNQGAASTRHRMSLDTAALEPLGREAADLWLGIRDALGDPAVKRLVFRRLANGITFRFGVSRADVEDVPAYPLPELYRETTGYSIKPHPDTRKKVVTMQMALPADDSQKDLGTTFYRLSAKPWALLREPRGFETVKQMPFLPNTAYAFVVLNTITKRSWHGREQLPSGCGTRNSLLHLYYADPADGSQELLPRYLPTRAAA